MLIGFDDQSTFGDGAGFWLPPKIAILTRRPMLAFNTISLPPANIRRHPHARTYVLGDRMFASVVPYASGWVSLAIVDMPEQSVLVARWTPERGFDRDPSNWLCQRRGRLRTTPGHTVLELAELLIDLVRERIDAVPGEIEEAEYAEMRRQHFATAFWEDEL